MEIFAERGARRAEKRSALSICSSSMTPASERASFFFFGLDLDLTLSFLSLNLPLNLSTSQRPDAHGRGPLRPRPLRHHLQAVSATGMGEKERKFDSRREEQKGEKKKKKKRPRLKSQKKTTLSQKKKKKTSSFSLPSPTS
jgi:hypothetical protein